MPEDTFPILFGQALGIITVLPNASVYRSAGFTMLSNGLHCRSKEELKLFYVSYLDVLDKNLRIDKIVGYLQCIQLNWHHTEGEVGRLYSARELGIGIMDSIRGIGQTFRQNTEIGSIHKSDRWCLNHLDVCEDDPVWESDLLYFNRHFRD